MKLFCFVTIAALVAIASTKPTEESESRIRGGKTVDAKGVKTYRFPYAVNLQAKGIEGVFCGGVIVAPQWILTAAHCFDQASPTHEIKVLAGTTDSTDYTGPTSQFIKVAKRFIHPGYDQTDFNQADIALVKLTEPLKMGQNVQAVGLPKFDHKLEGTGKVAGWGAIFSNQKDKSKDLKYAEFSTTDYAVCKKAYGDYSGEHSACVIGTFPDSACAGDSGGSFVQQDKATGKFVTTGVLSFGSDLCGTGPMVFTRVSDYAGWIKITMEN